MFTSDRGNTHFVTADGGREVHYIPNPVWSYHTFQVYDGVMYWAPGPPGTGASFGAYDVYEQGYLWVKRTTPGLNWYSFPALRGGRAVSTRPAGPGAHHDRQTCCSSTTRSTGSRARNCGAWRRSRFFGEAGERLYQPYRVFRGTTCSSWDYLAPGAVGANTVIYTSGDAVVRAFNSRNGREAWRHTFLYPTSSAPTVAGDRVYFGVRGDGVPGGRPPRLVALSAQNGKLLWEMDLEGAVLSAPVVAGKYLIFGTDQNYFLRPWKRCSEINLQAARPRTRRGPGSSGRHVPLRCWAGERLPSSLRGRWNQRADTEVVVGAGKIADDQRQKSGGGRQSRPEWYGSGSDSGAGWKRRYRAVGRARRPPSTSCTPRPLGDRPRATHQALH